MFDFVIIGSGVVGTSIARELSKYDVRVLVLEKGNDIANGQTMANSAIIHAGHDPKEKTLKAALCVRGNELYDVLEKELDLHILRTGGMVVAFSEEEEKILDELYQRSLDNNVHECHYLTKDEILKLEPNISNQVLKGLNLPSTKVTLPWDVAFAMMENAIRNGCELRLNHEVTQIKYQDNHYMIEVNHQSIIETTCVINAAGVYAEHIAKMIETSPGYHMLPRKGEYFVLDKKQKGFINHVIYPTPSSKGKGVLIVPQIHGNILVGPSSELIQDKEDVSTTPQALNYVMNHAKNLAPKLPFTDSIRNFSGLRASTDYHDFFIQESLEFKGFYHVAGIDSPGLTAAPAIAEYVCQMLENKEKITLKKTFYPERIRLRLFHEKSEEEKQRLYQEDHRYGHIICRCEIVTEMDVINAIKHPVGSQTIKGIKKRVRAGSGICQGGYCEGLVLRTIAKQTNQSLDQINYDQLNTQILLYETKVKS